MSLFRKILLINCILLHLLEWFKPKLKRVISRERNGSKLYPNVFNKFYYSHGIPGSTYDFGLMLSLTQDFL